MVLTHASDDMKFTVSEENKVIVFHVRTISRANELSVMRAAARGYLVSRYLWAQLFPAPSHLTLVNMFETGVFLSEKGPTMQVP